LRERPRLRLKETTLIDRPDQSSGPSDQMENGVIGQGVTDIVDNPPQRKPHYDLGCSMWSAADVVTQACKVLLQNIESSQPSQS